MKTGFVAILGRPNVGKSTLLNAMLSKKVSIVTPKAQTTRDAILGILTQKDLQIVFVDTPGIFYGQEKLYGVMKRTAFESSRGVDAVLYLIDASVKSLDDDLKIFGSIKTDAPRFFVLNKIDLIRPERGEELKSALKEAYPDVPLIEASLLENYGIREIKDAIVPLLSEGEMFYPEDVITDKDDAYQAKEVIREKMLHFLREEVPHQSAVVIDSIVNKDDHLKIKGRIIVEKKAHKAIVIGKGGEMIKKISMASRKELERMWHIGISSLTLEVEEIPGWRNDAKKLGDLGYGLE